MRPDYRPLISVVMPSWNRDYTIQNSIRSIVDQTYDNWELVIVDDGSTDATKKVVMNFANPKIKFIQLEHSGFISKVRNAGNALAKGEIIVVHDSDDQSFPDRLQSIVDAFAENPDADLVYHGMYQRFYDHYNNAIVRTPKEAVPFSKERLLREQYIPGQVAYKTSAILDTPYDERIKCCDDYQMLLEFCLKGKKFVPVFKNLYDYVNSPDSVNINGEIDGRRRKDVEVILSILKEKYGVEATAEMVRNTIGSEIVEINKVS